MRGLLFAVSIVVFLCSAQTCVAKAPSVFSPDSTRKTLYISIPTPYGLHFLKLKKSSLGIQVDASESHFKGVVRNSGIKPTRYAAASLIKGKLHVFFSTNRRDRQVLAIIDTKDSSPRLLRLSHPKSYFELDHDQLKPPSVSAVRISNLPANQPSSINLPMGLPLLSPARVLKLITVADRSMQAEASPEQINSEIRTFINAIDAIYAPQLGIRVELFEQNVLSTNENDDLSSNSADQLLMQLGGWVNNHLGQFDTPGLTVHLLTGKDLDGPVVGLAFVGSACGPTTEFKTGLSQKVNPALQPLVMAHEIAHNLGATHDSAPNSIMRPELSPSQTMFSSTSRQQIANTVTKEFSCLEPDATFSLDFIPQATSKNIKLEAIVTSYQTRSCSISILGALDPENLEISDLSKASVLFNGEISLGDQVKAMKLALSAKLEPKPKKALTLYTHTIMSCGSESLSSGISAIRIRGDLKRGINQKTWFRRLTSRLH